MKLICFLILEPSSHSELLLGVSSVFVLEEWLLEVAKKQTLPLNEEGIHQRYLVLVLGILLS